jgi:hypothetical protein
MSQPRPTYLEIPAKIDYGSTFTLAVDLPEGATDVTGTF